MGLNGLWQGGGPAHPGTPFDITPGATHGGEIVVAIYNVSGQRADPHPSNNYISGVSDSVGNTYSAVINESFKALYYESLVSPPGFVTINLAIFHATGRLGASDTVHIDAGDPDSDSTGDSVLIFDAANLRGAGTGYSSTYTAPYPGPGTFSPRSDPAGLGISVETSDDVDFLQVEAVWPDGSALALWGIGNASAIFYDLLTTTPWRGAWEGGLFAAYNPLPAQFHLPIQVRSWAPFEDETVPP